jgi:hypothetical protein
LGITDLTSNEKGKHFFANYLNIKQTELNRFSLNTKRSSRGRNTERAYQRAEAIQFSPELKGNVLLLENAFSINHKEKFRFQDLQVDLKVPKGKVIHLLNDCSCIIRSMEGVKPPYKFDLTGNKYWLMKNKGLVEGN